jgi:hypothetical protein
MRKRRMRLNTVRSVATPIVIAMMPLWQGCGDVLPGPLTADAGSDVSVALGQSIVLAGEADGGSGGYTYSWSPTTDLSNPNTAQPTFTATAIGVQTYTLTVRDSSGAVATDTVRVETAAQPLLADAGPDQTGVVGSTIVLFGSGTGGIGNLTYRWSSDPVVSPEALLDASTATPLFTPTDPGTYLFTLTVTDSQGFSDTDFTTVTVSSPRSPTPPGAGAGP